VKRLGYFNSLTKTHTGELGKALKLTDPTVKLLKGSSLFHVANLKLSGNGIWSMDQEIGKQDN
jgi:hypothetical protein